MLTLRRAADIGLIVHTPPPPFVPRASAQVVEFWSLFQQCVDSADKVSMLNETEK